MERCSKSSAGAASALPDDPLVEILSRVPAKSVCRFKCVSKAWRDLIIDPDNRKKLRQAMQGLVVQTLEIEKNEMARNNFSFIYLTLTVRSVPLDIYPSFSYLTEMTGIQTFLWDSCNGLILFGHCQQPSNPRYYTVCNPTTKQWSAVPACGSGEALSVTYLAFDPAVSSHFHLVQFQVPANWEIESLHVYSSETGTWTQNQIKEQGQLEGWPHQFTLDRASNNLRAFINGFLHVIVSHSDLHQILVVDVQGKARRMIAVPGMSDGTPENTFVCYLGQSQGHLHCVTLNPAYEKNGKLFTWVLQDYDTQEWVLKNTVNSLDIFGEKGSISDFQVVDIHQDCNLVFFLQHCQEYKLTAYDMDRKEMSVIATFEDRKLQCDFDRYVPYFSESPALTNKY